MEDNFQSTIKKKYGNAIVYSLIYSPDSVLMASRMQTYCEQHLSRWKHKVIFTSSLGNIEFLIKNVDRVKLICIKDKALLILYDHLYIGGGFFSSSSNILLGNKKEIEFPTRFRTLLSSLKFTFCLPDIMSYSPRLKPDRDVCIRKNIIYQIIGESSTKAYAIYRNCREIFNNTDIRTIRILLPIAFGGSSKVNNNVGAIILDINYMDTPEDIDIMLDKEKYQATATNYILNNISFGGEYTRSCVDCVMTIFHTEICDVDVKSIEVSYFNKPSYGVYALSIILENKAYLTLTIYHN